MTISEEEAVAKREAEKKRLQGKRMPPAPVTEEDQAKTNGNMHTVNTTPAVSHQDDEEVALEQLTVIPLAEKVGIPVTGSGNPDGLRQRAPYLFRTSSDQMGMRNPSGPIYSPPFYPPPQVTHQNHTDSE